MKKTYYALLIGLASLTLAGAQTNDALHTTPSVKPTNGMAATTAVAPAAANETFIPATAQSAEPKADHAAATAPTNVQITMDRSAIAYSNLMHALASTNPATIETSSVKPSPTKATSTATNNSLLATKTTNAIATAPQVVAKTTSTNTASTNMVNSGTITNATVKMGTTNAKAVVSAAVKKKRNQHFRCCNFQKHNRNQCPDCRSWHSTNQVFRCADHHSH